MKSSVRQMVWIPGDWLMNNGKRSKSKRSAPRGGSLGALKMLKPFVLILIVGLSLLSFPQHNKETQKETGRTIGFELVFVVDVSPVERGYMYIIENFVTSVYEAFRISPQTDFHLVTFAEKPELFKADKIDKSSILKEIKEHMRGKHNKIYPQVGLRKVLTIFEDNFPGRVGIVLFISPGKNFPGDPDEDPGQQDLKETIHLLKKNGFTVFSIFISSAQSRNMCKECMQMISKWAGTGFYQIEKGTNIPGMVDDLLREALDIDFSSPVPRSKYNQLKLMITDPPKKNETLKSPAEIDSLHPIGLKKNNFFQLLSFVSLGILIVVIIFLLIKLKRERAAAKIRQPFTEPTPVIPRPEEIRPNETPGLNDQQEERESRESLFPEYPAACRCKDKIEIREVIAIEAINGFLEKRESTRKAPIPIKLLDLCCGNGNILAQLETSNRESCAKIEYYGYDLDKRNIDECEELIRSKRLREHYAGVEVDVVNLYTSPIPGNQKFDIITLLNVLHEIEPSKIYSLLKKALLRCKHDGFVLIVDMCTLPHIEWNAVTWQKHDLRELVSYLTKYEKNIYGIHHIPVYQRTVEVFSLRLWKKSIHERLFSNWGHKKEKQKRQEIISGCLQDKKNRLSEKLKDMYSIGNVMNGQEKRQKDKEWEKELVRNLTEYRSVCESLSEFKR